MSDRSSEPPEGTSNPDPPYAAQENHPMMAADTDHALRRTWFKAMTDHYSKSVLRYLDDWEKSGKPEAKIEEKLVCFVDQKFVG